MLGHDAAATTLDIYTHSTSDMRAAAQKIDWRHRRQNFRTSLRRRRNTPAIVDFQP
ncbi:MAG: hypothetical protein ACLR8L_06780 [Oscillospiraceae bacterium]